MTITNKCFVAYMLIFPLGLFAQVQESENSGLIDQPETTGEVHTQSVADVNPLTLQPTFNNYESYANLALDYFPLIKDSLLSPIKTNLGFFQMDGSLGSTWFGNAQFYEISLRTIFTFFNFRIALRGDLRFDKDWKIREEDWSQGVISYLRLLEFVEYGTPYELFYARFGSLDRLTLGNGSIVNMYSNTVSYDLRRPGIHVRLNFSVWGLQVFTADVTKLSVIGARAFVRPLYMLNIPVVNTIEVGASAVADFRNHSGFVADASGNIPGTSYFLKKNAMQETPAIFGVDLAIPVLQLPYWDMKITADYARFLNGGNGISAGFINMFNIANVVNLSVRFEHRENLGGMVFGYFNNFYETLNYREIGVNGDTISTAWNKAKSGSAWRGFKAIVAVNVMGRVAGVAGYERRYDSYEASQFYAYLEAPDILPSFSLRAEYFKRDSDFNLSLFALDDKATARLMASYIFKFIHLSVVSQWTFSPEKNISGEVIGYTPHHNLFFRTGVSFKI